MRERLAAQSVGVPLGHRPLRAVAIGASTGGPKVLEGIVSGLPARLGVPVLICVHMPPGFTSMFAERLDHLSPLTVKKAEHAEDLHSDVVYLAPIGTQMRVKRVDDGMRLSLDPDFSDSLFVPSIDILFSSFADAYGSLGLGVLLTGLGSDGAVGLLQIRRAGGHTLVERPATAVADPMPAAAIALEAAEEMADAADMAEVIVERVRGIA